MKMKKLTVALTAVVLTLGGAVYINGNAAEVSSESVSEQRTVIAVRSSGEDGDKTGKEQIGDITLPKTLMPGQEQEKKPVETEPARALPAPSRDTSDDLPVTGSRAGLASIIAILFAAACIVAKNEKHDK